MNHAEIARRLGCGHCTVHARKLKGRNRWSVSQHSDAKLGVSVEKAALAAFQQEGWDGVHDEGKLIKALVTCMAVPVNESSMHLATEYCEDSFYLFEELRQREPLFKPRNWQATHSRLSTVSDTDIRRSARFYCTGTYYKEVGVTEDAVMQLYASIGRLTAIRLAYVLTNDVARIFKNGWPDLTMWRDGSVLFAEVKAPRDSLSNQQAKILSHVLVPLQCSVTLVDVIASDGPVGIRYDRYAKAGSVDATGEQPSTSAEMPDEAPCNYDIRQSPYWRTDAMPVPKKRNADPVVSFVHSESVSPGTALNCILNNERFPQYAWLACKVARRIICEKTKLSADASEELRILYYCSWGRAAERMSGGVSWDELGCEALDLNTSDVTQMVRLWGAPKGNKGYEVLVASAREHYHEDTGDSVMVNYWDPQHILGIGVLDVRDEGDGSDKNTSDFGRTEGVVNTQSGEDQLISSSSASSGAGSSKRLLEIRRWQSEKMTLHVRGIAGMEIVVKGKYVATIETDDCELALRREDGEAAGHLVAFRKSGSRKMMLLRWCVRMFVAACILVVALAVGGISCVGGCLHEFVPIDRIALNWMGVSIVVMPD